MALSDQLQTVRSWFASTPGANPNPSEEDLKYYAEQGINKFLSDVATVRAANPQLASSIDQQRAAMMPFGSVTGSLFTGVLPTAQGGLPGVSQGNYVPFSALLQPYGSRGYGNYGYGPGMMMQPAMQSPAQPPAARPSTFPAFDLSSWYGQPATSAASQTSVASQASAGREGMLANNPNLLALITAAVQAAMQGQRAPGTVPAATAPAATVPSSSQLKSVSDLYASIGRVGDQEGTNYWAGRLASGESLEDVSNAFKASANYVQQREAQQQQQPSDIFGNITSAPKADTGATAMPLQILQTVEPTDQRPPSKPIDPTKPTKPYSDRLEDIRLAFQSIPGANPNPDQAALEYYASQGIDKLKADVAFIRQANPGLAAQIDAERAKLGLS